MSDQDRGAYTPQHDTPLSFDARYSRGSGERPVPMTLIVSGVVLLVMVVGFFIAYRSGARHTGQAPQVVGTPVASTKAPPSSGVESSDAAAGLQVYKTEGTPPDEMKAPATLAPPPEQPAPRPAPIAKPVVKADLRPAQPDVAPTAVATIKPAAKPARPPQTIEAAVDQSTSETGPVAQIGAFSSQALAEKGWNDVAAIQPGKMAGKTKKVEVANRDGKTLYRAFVGGFASRSDASAFCASLVAAGKGCIVK
jgi:cell division septation protein DedD